ncbi:MAG TPA: PEGA domain-containing protein [Polyangiaceae bacterium]|jgi:hypothetical protein
MKTRAAVLALGLALAAPSAFAQSNEDTVAKLKAAGDAKMHDLHFGEALEQYDAALKLGGSGAIQYNRARAFEGLGDYPRALDALEEFVRTSDPELRARVPQLAELIADIRAHVAVMSITTNAPHATVRVRHDLVGTTPIAVPVRLSIGTALIEADAPGYRHYARTMTLRAGDGRLDIALEPIESETTGGRPSFLRPAGIAVGGVGLAGIALGAVFGGVAMSKRSDLDTLCPNQGCDPIGAQARTDAWTFATLSTVGFIAGGTLLAAGAVMFLLAPRAHRTLAVVPVFGPGAIGLEGTF